MNRYDAVTFHCIPAAARGEDLPSLVFDLRAAVAAAIRWRFPDLEPDAELFWLVTPGTDPEAREAFERMPVDISYVTDWVTDTDCDGAWSYPTATMRATVYLPVAPFDRAGTTLEQAIWDYWMDGHRFPDWVDGM